jgi:predicted MPP superfamily phosphohydrolase
MILFLLAFFTIYGGMNLYVFVRVKAAFSLGMKGSIPLGFLFVFMVAAPVIVRFLEQRGLEALARLLAYVGYGWLGMVFLFISVSLVIDCYKFILYTSSVLLHKDVSAMLPSARVSFYLPLVLSLLVYAYGYLEAKNIRTERVTVATEKLPSTSGRIRIVQISDVHLGLIVRQGRLGRILDIVREETPDILVSTGDLVDAQLDNLTELRDMLRMIQPRHGKFAVTGNHEYYAGLEQALAFTEDAGFRVLRDEAVTVRDVISIAGAEYRSRNPGERTQGISEARLLESLPRGTFTLLLKHVPVVDEEALGSFDLQLSGHTHRGQIFPFTLVTKLAYPRMAGFHGLPGASSLYVSRGSGTWGPPIRVLAPPEVTIIDIVPKGS